VRCVVENACLVTDLEEGRMPFHEPDLEELVLHGVQQARLSFADDSGS
jgi:hypothetical protein